jgi:hypothetical protein
MNGIEGSAEEADVHGQLLSEFMIRSASGQNSKLCVTKRAADRYEDGNA